MGIRIDNWTLIDTMRCIVESTADRYFSYPVPTTFHYYTKFPTAQSIIRSRSIWATCLASQKNDDTELLDAIGAIKDEAQRVARKGIEPLSKAIFERIGPVMESRRKWSFITCFCGDEDSRFHWGKYGEYRFDIPSNLVINGQFECGSFKSQQWIQPVIYDFRMQKRLIGECFEQILEAQAKCISGEYGGPWMETMANSAARDVAQLLLRIAVSFKNKRFEKDREWRLVFCPNLAVANSAPAIADEDFAVCIRADKVRHIELQLRRPFELFQPVRVSQPPFKSLAQSPKLDNKSEREILNDLLRDNGATGIMCEKAHRTLKSRLIDLVFRD
jgi:hypothetical protein